MKWFAAAEVGLNKRLVNVRVEADTRKEAVLKAREELVKQGFPVTILYIYETEK